MKVQRRNSEGIKGPGHRGGLPPRKLRVVLEYIQAHLHENVSLRTMAAQLEMSPYHFGRAFKQSTGLTPHQYLLVQRIAKARQLLADDRLSIQEISRRVGFASRAHFTTVFRKQLGTTPREYRMKSGK